MLPSQIKAIIEERIEGAQATVTNLTGRDDDPNADHLKAEVVAPAFEGKTPIQQHKMVYEALGDLMKGPIHALQLTTRSS